MIYPDEFVNKIINGDCLQIMADIPSGIIDMILCDLPYNTTAIEWDKLIPFKPLWEHYNRIIKPNGAILLFSSQPFTTDLINSNRQMFRYEIIWRKSMVTGFLNAKKMPLRVHENILVFYKKLPTYNPQKFKVERNDIGRTRKNGTFHPGKSQWNSYFKSDWRYKEDGSRFPLDVIFFSNWNGALFGNIKKAVQHPTQKPVDLFEYLIKTYTNAGDLVLDNCIGSGTTAIAARDTGRNFIGIELKREYCDLAENRLKKEQTHEEKRENHSNYQSRF